MSTKHKPCNYSLSLYKSANADKCVQKKLFKMLHELSHRSSRVCGCVFAKTFQNSPAAATSLLKSIDYTLDFASVSALGLSVQREYFPAARFVIKWACELN